MNALQAVSPQREVNQWTAICHLLDIPALGSRRVARAGSTAVAIFRTADNQVFALLDHCPHKGGPLSQGIVFGHSVACPLHNWTIALDSGEARAPDVGCAVSFACKVEGEQVFLDADELATKALDAAVPVAGPQGKIIALAVSGAKPVACN